MVNTLSLKIWESEPCKKPMSAHLPRVSRLFKYGSKREKRRRKVSSKSSTHSCSSTAFSCWLMPFQNSGAMFLCRSICKTSMNHSSTTVCRPQSRSTSKAIFRSLSPIDSSVPDLGAACHNKQEIRKQDYEKDTTG